jgi:hypothetical protein
MGPPETIVWNYPADDPSWALELVEFENDIRAGRVTSGLDEGIRTLEIVEAIYRHSGYPVSTASF